MALKILRKGDVIRLKQATRAMQRLQSALAKQFLKIESLLNFVFFPFLSSLSTPVSLNCDAIA